MYLDWYIIIIVIFIAGMIGYANGKEDGYKKGWEDRRRRFSDEKED